jgi:hypothetical protein
VVILLVPVVFSEVHNDGNQHGEGLFFVGFENIEEIVVLKEAHGSISHLQMNASNALNDALE